MSKRTSLLAQAMIVLALTAIQTLSQSTYEPYTFTTLAIRGNCVAVDGAGNIYVTINNTIRKVTSAGVVTTLAGSSLYGGSADGTGSAARFGSYFSVVSPGVAVDSGGNVYVADFGNSTIRKVTPAGVVTTLAGSPGSLGSGDGTGSAANFNRPSSLAVDSSGNVYVADSGVIRKGCPENVPALIDTSKPGFGFNGGAFGFLLSGPTGQLVVVETSTNLANWLPIWTNTFAGARYFSDPQSGVYSRRFYRARTP